MGSGKTLCARVFVIMLQALSLTLPLGGCLLNGDKPDPALDIPVSYTGVSAKPTVAEAALPPLDWWRSFRSRELTAIVEEARANNLDVAAAVARIVQADAQSRVTGAALLPSVDLNASATRSRPSQSTSSSTGVSLGASEQNDLIGTLNASYEIDFWGKNRSALRAMEELAVASRHDREVVDLATVAANHLKAFDVQDPQTEADGTRSVIFSEGVDLTGVPGPLQDIAHDPGNRLSTKRTAIFALQNGAWTLQSIT